MDEDSKPKRSFEVSRGEAIKEGFRAVFLAALTITVSVAEAISENWFWAAVFGVLSIPWFIGLFMLLTHRIEIKD